MHPKYSIGEVVILQSKGFPKYNGEHVVRAISIAGSEYTCRVSGITFEQELTDHNIGYVMEEILPDNYDGDDEDIQGVAVEVYWDESSLRKKHQKGDYSFSELMSTLKLGEKA